MRSSSTEDAKTVGALVEALVATELAYDEIVRMVRARFPDARTTARSVASVASVLRKRGVAVQMRRMARTTWPILPCVTGSEQSASVAVGPVAYPRLPHDPEPARDSDEAQCEGCNA